MPVELPQGYSGRTGGVDGTHHTHDSHLDSFTGQQFDAQDCIFLSMAVELKVCSLKEKGFL